MLRGLRKKSSHGYAVFSLRSRESHGIAWQILICPSSGGFQHLVPEKELPSPAGGEGVSVRASSLAHTQARNLSSKKKKRL